MNELKSHINFSHKTTVISSNSLELHIGHEVFKLLADEGFQQDWDVLYRDCSWATAFQSRAFVATWYQVYKEKYLPIVVKRVENGKLTGLLTMTRGKDGVIIGAGANLAEYQVWLATDSSSEAFITKALAEIRKRFTNAKIRFIYIPGNTPLRWATQDPGWRKNCVVRVYKQAIMKIDEAQIARELKKKNRREKFNRLKRLGALRFECITDKDLFYSFFNELTIQYDFRQGAKFNKSFFQADPLRSQFLLKLFEQDLLHVTLLKLNDAIIASNVGITGKNWVHLQGVNTHAPQYAKHSPGILHFLLLGQQLAAEGIEVFDLTPGGNSYKEDLATDYTSAYELCVGSVPFRMASNVKFFLLDVFKKAIFKTGNRAKTFQSIKKHVSLMKEKAMKLKEQGLYPSIKNMREQGRASGDVKKYVTTINVSVSAVATVAVKKDSLGDLLRFTGKGTWMTRWEFLENAMRRFEVGEHCYSWCEQENLMGCVWLGRGQKLVAESQQSSALAAEAPLLQGFYGHPAAREQWPAFLAAVAAQVARDQEQEQVYAAVPSKDKNLGQILQTIGFKILD